jgi:hypothetical protein
MIANAINRVGAIGHAEYRSYYAGTTNGVAVGVGAIRRLENGAVSDRSRIWTGHRRASHTSIVPPCRG